MTTVLRALSLLSAQASLRLDSAEVRITHAKAVWFLEAVAAAAQQGKELTSAELAAIWKRKTLGSAPTRTDVTRMLRALQVGLAQLAAASGVEILASITHAPRCATTGPWRLTVGDGWTVELASAVGNEEPTGRNSKEKLALIALAEEPCPLKWARVAQHLARIDSLINEGYYADALALFNAPRDAQLSAQMRLVQGLRKARILRRMGTYAAAEQVLAEVLENLNASDLGWRMHAYVKAQHELMTVRTAFDARPIAASKSTEFERLRETLDCAPNPAMQWEWCNFKALALRRKLDALAAKTPLRDRVVIQVECKELAQKIQALFASAYAWAALAHDMWAAQAIAINLAFNLQMHIRDGFLVSTAEGAQDDYSPCLAWYALAHGLVDQFNLPQDSAWDFIMLGELVLGQPAARAQLASNASAWPESSNPLQVNFYERSIELAGQFGGVRQKLQASNQMVQFLKLVHQGSKGLVMPAIPATERNQRVSVLRQQMTAWLQEEPESAADMLRDGFVMQ